MNSKSQDGVFRWPVYFDKKSKICLASENYSDNHVLVLCHHQAQDEDRRTKQFRTSNLYTDKCGEVKFTFKQLTKKNVAAECWNIHGSIGRAAFTNIIWATCNKKNCTNCNLANDLKNKYIQEEIINSDRESNIEDRIFRTRNIFKLGETLGYSRCVVTSSGWKSFVLKLIEDNKMKNEVDQKILIITGSHGNQQGHSSYDHDGMIDKKGQFFKSNSKKIEELRKNKITDKIDFHIIKLDEFKQKEYKVVKEIKSGKYFVILAWCYSSSSLFKKRLESKWAIKYSLIISCTGCVTEEKFGFR